MAKSALNLPAFLDRRGGALTDFKAEETAKKIAVAEAAEIWAARAKDGAKLYEAIEYKLGEQRRFVLWWDEQEKAAGSLKRGIAPASQTNDAGTTLSDLGLDRDTVFRWRKKLADPAKFEEELERANEKCIRICEASKGQTAQRGASGTGENEWYTPENYIEMARQVLGGIDLDPASSEQAQEKVRAVRFFDKEWDGLRQQWLGRVWLNPPYAQPHIADFVSKMVAERRAGRVSAGIMLTHNYTDTAWFHEAASCADAICFTRGRVRFYGPKGQVAAPTQGQAFFYFGDDVDIFADVFGSTGFVVEVRK